MYLLQALCGEHDEGACVLRSVVHLQTNLECDRTECDVEAPRLFRLRVTDTISEDESWAYFEWARPACVELAFYAGAKVVTRARKDDESFDRCADPATPAAGVCCSTKKKSNGARITQGLCEHALERVSYALGAKRCEAVTVQGEDGFVCPNSKEKYQAKRASE